MGSRGPSFVLRWFATRRATIVCPAESIDVARYAAGIVGEKSCIRKVQALLQVVICGQIRNTAQLNRRTNVEKIAIKCSAAVCILATCPVAIAAHVLHVDFFYANP